MRRNDGTGDASHATECAPCPNERLPRAKEARDRSIRNVCSLGQVFDGVVCDHSTMRRLVVPLLATIVAVAGCGHRRVAMPPTHAGPKTVVFTFLDALSAHDTATARRMLTPREATRMGSFADSWLTNVKSIRGIVVKEPVPDRSPDYAQAVRVPVEFELHQRESMSMPDGHTVWAYLVVRNSDAERWLIDEEGVG